MSRRLSHSWPLLISLLLLWALIAALFQTAMRMGRGHFVYALDDPYIHMAMARHYVEQGVLGVTAEHFTSASSSVLWISLLCLSYSLVGVSDLAPFVLNIVFATLLVVLAAAILRRSAIGGRGAAFALIALIFVTPLPAIIFSGLEHVLHTLLTVALVYAASDLLLRERQQRQDWPQVAGVAALACGVVAARYEGMFLVLTICALLALRRRFGVAALVFGLGWLPIISYGLYSLANGAFFLPNSVLLKGQTPSFTSPEGLLLALGLSGYRALAANPPVLLLLLSALGLLYARYSRRPTIWQPGVPPLIMFIAITLLHSQFAKFGWFYRYEAYLVALGLLANTTALPALMAGGLHLPRGTARPAQAIAAAFLLLLTAPLAERGFSSLNETPLAIRNIYEQHYQMARFVAQFYSRRMVALHDIGLVGYTSDAYLLDLWGLADVEVAQAFRAGRYGPKPVARIAAERHAQIAIMSERWLRQLGGVPPGWQRVGRWQIAENEASFSSEIAFYAVEPAYAPELIANLRAFAPTLPETVTQDGDYVDAAKQ